MSSSMSPRRPGWMDDDFLKVCIGNDTGASLANIDIEDVKLYYVVPKGENFTSVVLRATVSGRFGHARNGRASNDPASDQVDQVNYILKVSNEDEYLKGFIEHFLTFDKEVKMYFKYLPEFQKILLEGGISTDFACKGIHIREANEVFVLEDLGPLGYILSDRIAGNDWDHSRLVVAKMAMLHAASMRYFQKNSTAELSDIYYNSFIPENEDDKLNGRVAFADKANLMIASLKLRPGYEREIDIMTRAKDIAYDLVSDAWKYKKGNIFNTLLHGDMWINNIMFKYEKNGKPSDVRMIDLQCSYYNSTAVEFLYYFFSSVSDDVRKNRFEDLVELYYETFVDTLETIGFEGPKPTLEQWKQEVNDRLNLFIFGVSMLSFVKTLKKKENEDRSQSESVTEDEFKDIIAGNASSPVYLNSLFHLVHLLRKQRVFERLEKTLESKNL